MDIREPGYRDNVVELKAKKSCVQFGPGVMNGLELSKETDIKNFIEELFINSGLLGEGSSLGDIVVSEINFLEGRISYEDNIGSHIVYISLDGILDLKNTILDFLYSNRLRIDFLDICDKLELDRDDLFSLDSAFFSSIQRNGGGIRISTNTLNRKNTDGINTTRNLVSTMRQLGLQVLDSGRNEFQGERAIPDLEVIQGGVKGAIYRELRNCIPNLENIDSVDIQSDGTIELISTREDGESIFISGIFDLSTGKYAAGLDPYKMDIFFKEYAKTLRYASSFSEGSVVAVYTEVSSGREVFIGVSMDKMGTTIYGRSRTPNQV